MKHNKSAVAKGIKLAVQLCAIALLILIDALIKNAVAAHLRRDGHVTLIPGFIGLVYAENTGAAFSLFSSSTAMLSVFTAVVLIAGIILLIVLKNKPRIYDICIPLLIAGGAGNLIDRIFRGYVIDYIETLFISFPVFNFADCLITCSCIAVIIYLIWDIFAEHKRSKTAGEKSDG